MTTKATIQRTLALHNPLIGGADFPDPSVISTPEGFYAYATSEVGGQNIQMAFSNDLANWELKSGALVYAPHWTCEKLEFWAPDVKHVDNEYRMYYTAMCEGIGGKGVGNMGIGVAKSKLPYNFIGLDEPLLSGTNYQVIDPCFFRDPKTGSDFLFYGSNFEPIRVRELNSEGTGFANSKVYEILHTQPGRRWHNLYEGVYITYKEELDTYFAWVSSDGTWTRYGVIVFAAKHVLGPYQELNDGLPILRSNMTLQRPGQNCVFEYNHEDYMAFHAINRRDKFVPGTKHYKRAMCVERINYVGGEPTIQGGTPNVIIPVI